MTRLTIVVSIVLIFASPLFAQNLLVNPGFDNPDLLTGWTCSTIHGQANWIPDDRMGEPTSGSMEHFVTAGSNNLTVSCLQCVPVEELNAHTFSTWYYWPDDPDVIQDGSSRLSLIYYSNPDCTSSTGVATVKVGHHPSLDTWYQLISAEITAPAGTTSALVTVATWQDLGGDWVRARLDDLDFSTTTLFRDDFESGGTGAWTSTFP